MNTTTSLSGSVVSYSWDFNGSGTDAVTCYTHPGVAARYQYTGLYSSKVTVKDAEGNSYADIAIVNVLDPSQMDSLFKQIWNGMKEKMFAQDVEGVVAYFPEFTQDAYRQYFTSLLSYLPQMAADMGEFRQVKLIDGLAEYDLRTIRNGEVYSFQVLFMRDQDGSWRIRSF